MPYFFALILFLAGAVCGHGTRPPPQPLLCHCPDDARGELYPQGLLERAGGG